MEDSPTQAERLRLLLEVAGYRVIMAANGREGLEIVRSSRPDLIISDVVMPEMDGYAFCRAVKSVEATRRIPFVLLTERKDPANIILGLEKGADNFITKPFEDDQLLDRVRRIFEHLEHRRRGHLEMEVAVHVGGKEIVLSADKQQIIELLFATFEDLGRVNTQLADSQRTIEEYARRLEAMVQERSEQLRSLFEGVPVGLHRTTPDGQILDANPALVQMLGYPDRESLLRVKTPSLYVNREDRRVFRSRIERDGVVRDFEAQFRQRDGTVIWTQANARAVRDEGGRVLYYEGSVQDITARKRAEAELRARARQHAAIAELGQQAQPSARIQLFLNEAATVVARTLEVEYCKILELGADGQTLRLCAGAGWKSGYVEDTTVPAGVGSQAGYTLMSSAPVIVEDLRTETRFAVPQFLVEHGVVSSVSVVIVGQDRPFGVLGADTRRQRAFTDDEVHFLQAVAN
ncbi:MAG: response regulator, partial [Gemmatimonadetes bacterium]|nr:response regulator [Gemmatimonadota bacterium]